jgi:hypothetical protein
MAVINSEGVLVTGVYGSGKSSVAAEIACLLEQRRQPYALLDLDFLGWGVNYSDDDSAGLAPMLRNLATDVTTERQEELREAARQITAGEGVGPEDVAVTNDRPVGAVARQVMSWLGWV